MTGSVLTNDGPASSPFPDLPSCSLKACDESGEVVSGHASRLSVATVEKRLWCGLGKIYTLRNAPVSVAAADASVVILGK
jgi:hypothetical protein